VTPDRLDTSAFTYDAEMATFGESVRMADHLVVFADALGTKSFQSDIERSHEFLWRLLPASRATTRRLSLAEHHANGFHYRWFSDNVSLCVPVTDVTSLELALRTAAQMQVEFVIQGVFLRGAATIGPHHHSVDMDYGPALTEAAEMEDQLARFPRIVLSRSLVDRLMLSTGLRALALVDSTDGSVLLHFLRYLDISGYRAVKENVTFALDHASNEEVRAKYSWMAGYFNYHRGQREIKGVPPIDLNPL
jgi:hypothetical protein